MRRVPRVCLHGRTDVERLASEPAEPAGRRSARRAEQPPTTFGGAGLPMEIANSSCTWGRSRLSDSLSHPRTRAERESSGPYATAKQGDDRSALQLAGDEWGAPTRRSWRITLPTTTRDWTTTRGGAGSLPPWTLAGSGSGVTVRRACCELLRQWPDASTGLRRERQGRAGRGHHAERRRSDAGRG